MSFISNICAGERNRAEGRINEIQRAAEDAARAAAEQDIVQENQLNSVQQQLNDTTVRLGSSNQQIQVNNVQLAANQQRIAADTTTIQSLNAQLINCNAEDYVNIKNILKSYTTAVNNNTALVKSVGIQDIANRLTAVAEKNAYLEQEKAAMISSIEQHERDFVDLRDALPEVLPTTSVHILDDYTMWMLVLSYSLFVVSVIFYYCYIHSYTPTSILISTVSAAFLTIILFILTILLL